jgi:hypothetical protein
LDNPLDFLQQILYLQGMLLWRDKYTLIYIDSPTANSDQEWEGYEILEIKKDKKYKRLYSSNSVQDALEEFYELMQEDLDREEMQEEKK